MIRSEIIEHLKESTVKIDVDDGYRIGSGFFIADGLIATCFHVIEDFSSKQIIIYWQGNEYSVKSIESNPNDDLSLLEVDIKKHPKLQVDNTAEVGNECYSFGFSKTNGDVIDFSYVGKDGDNLLKFKGELFQSGMSGSPILNLQTHKIFGIVKSTRDEEFPTGGHGIPISKLSNFERLDIDDNGSIFSKEMFKNWVWTSSVESADRLQFSVLALVETLVAVGLSFFVWIYYGFYWHIVTGLVVAPLFLLRTEKSEIQGLHLFEKDENILFTSIVILGSIIGISIYWWDSLVLFKFCDNLIPEYILKDYLPEAIDTILSKINEIIISTKMLISSFFDFEQKPNTFIKKVYVCIIPLIVILVYSLPFLLIKSFVTINNLSYLSIQMIPKNWFKTILSIDLFHPIELMPGIEKTNSHFKMKRIIFNAISTVDYFLQNLYIIIYIILVFLPSLLFRYSLKSTAWIYLPLIWLIQPQDKQNLSTRLKIESKNFIAYLMFFYSLIVVFVFTLLPLIFPHTQLGVYLQTLAIPPTLKSIFFAYEFNLWHLTRLLSALITIVFMLSFTKILIRRETEPSYGDFWGTKLLSLRTVRSVLTLVTLGFTAYHILGLLPENFFGDLWVNMKVA